jgi:murein DD-endopeptidase MepM/ murein hydrolase activator NlpD
MFPERQLLLKSSGSVRSIRFPGWLQAMVVVACFGTLASAGFLSAQYVALHRTLDQIAGTDNTSLLSLDTDTPDAARAIANGTAMVDLNRQFSALNGQYTALKAQHDADQDKINALAAQVAALSDAASKANAGGGQAATDLTSTLNAVRAELQSSEAQRADQAKKMAQLESDMQTVKRQNDEMKTQLAAKDQALQQVTLERDRIRATLNNKSGNAGPVLVPPAGNSPGNAQGKPGSALVPPAGNAQNPPGFDNEQNAANMVPPVDDEQTDSLVDNPTSGPPMAYNSYTPSRGNGSASRNAGGLEDLLASTGLDVDRLLARINPSAGGGAGQGGPFVAMNSPAAIAAGDGQRQAQLQKLLKTLPLNAPLNYFSVGSGFGPRRDPFNGREAFHTGLDLEAPYRTPVYSTAPGTVLFTGVREGYGRTVEIDHGNGIVTRFAHLHRIVVARGQHIGAHFQVGELGSTGRSTGPHLHYEIIVDGRPLDPAKFLEAGKNVVQARAQQ